MSAEYVARMEVLQHKREELTAQRQAIEKRMALREATAAEFSAVALQSCKQKWKARRSAAITAKKRNDEFVRALHETQKQVHDAWSKLQSDQSSSSALLAQEKANYNRRVEQIYPAWQEQLQRQRVQKLRVLEDKKRAVERRRYLAKLSFESEQTLDDLIRKTRHEVEMAESLEQNELYERELLRTQSTKQAKDVGQSIREVALEARSHLQQQAAKHLEVAPELDEELAEKLSETFSPWNTLRALQGGSSAFTFEENQQYEEKKPARQIRVEFPVRMNTSTRAYYAEDSQRGPNQGYSDDEDLGDHFVYEVPQEFNEKTASFNAMVEASANAGNDNSDFERNVWREQPAALPRNQPPRIDIAYSVPDLGRTRSQAVSFGEDLRMEQQHAAPSSIHAYSEAHEAIGRQRDRLEVLPTLVTTGKLYSIPEASEPISSGGTSLMAPDKAIIRDSKPKSICKREHVSSGVADTSAMSTSTDTDSRVSLPAPSASTHPANIEENCVMSSPAATITVATPVDGTLHHRLNADRLTERPKNAVEPEHSIEEAVTQTSPAITISEPVESSVMSSSITERSAEVPLQEWYNKPSSKIEFDAPASDEKPSVEGDVDRSPSIDSVSSPSQLDASSDTRTPNIATFEHLLETKEIPVEVVDTNQRIAGIEVASRACLKNDTIDYHDFERSLGQESSSKDFFHDTTLIRDSKLSVLETSPLDDVEILAEIEENANKKAIAAVSESPSPSISYRTDLLEPFSPPASTPVDANPTEDDIVLTSMQSDDFDLSICSIKPAVGTKPSVPSVTTSVENSISPVVNVAENLGGSPESPNAAPAEVATVSITEKLSPVDRVKALGALISRVEEGATEGDTLSGSIDTGSSNESKRELLKMAVGGRKAQIAFFGSDICFELILDISRDVGPVLFPPKAFEGIMNDQKIRKLHQSNKEKQLDLWKALSGHLKQVVHLKAIPAATLVDLFVTVFLAHDPDNQRSQRKLREFLVTVCGGGGRKTPSPRKETSATSPPPSPPKQEQRSPSPEPAKPAEPEDRIGTPQLLQTAFLQRQSPPKPKVFGIASSSFKNRSNGSSDVLMSMSSGSMKLSQKLMRGGKMNDYSEFEEEEEVDLQNLIGTKPTASMSSALGYRSHEAFKTSPTSKSAAKPAAAEEEEDEFDADF